LPVSGKKAFISGYVGVGAAESQHPQLIDAYRHPSFSWAALDANVLWDYALLQTERLALADFSVLDIYHEGDVFGLLSTYRITVLGCLCEAYVRPATRSSFEAKPDTMVSPDTVWRQFWHEDCNAHLINTGGIAVGNPYLDLQPTEEALTCLLLFTDIVEPYGTIEHILLLKRTSPSTRTYERKGIAELWRRRGKGEGLDWNKPRRGKITIV
jgi:hypothetical protein